MPFSLTLESGCCIEKAKQCHCISTFKNKKIYFYSHQSSLISINAMPSRGKLKGLVIFCLIFFVGNYQLPPEGYGRGESKGRQGPAGGRNGHAARERKK